MSDEVGLENSDQRVFLVDVRGRDDRRVDGRLYCGFCRRYYDVSWYPENSQQNVERKTVLEHFQDCPARGRVNSFDMAVFDGPGEPKTVHIRI